MLKRRLGHAGVSAIEIERAANKLKVNILTSRPGIIIGRKGVEVDRLKDEIRKRTQRDVFINILEIDKPEIDAQLVAESIAHAAGQAHRLPPRDAQGGRVGAALRRQGHQGARRRPAGRRARSPAPSGTSRASCRCTRCAPTSTTASPRRSTTYGVIGVKVWIYRGESRDIRVPDGGHALAARRGGADEEIHAMLMPSKVKFRKQQRGRRRGKAQTRLHRVASATSG